MPKFLEYGLIRFLLTPFNECIKVMRVSWDGCSRREVGLGKSYRTMKEKITCFLMTWNDVEKQAGSLSKKFKNEDVAAQQKSEVSSDDGRHADLAIGQA